MHDQFHMAEKRAEQNALHRADSAISQSDNWVESPCKLDGSIEAMVTCLEALVNLTCQNNSEYSVPVLALQFGEISTMTSVLVVSERGYLSITALLPRRADDVVQSTACLNISTKIDGARNLLWHADKGCYVIERKLPVSIFLNERSVLDAIADAADEATVWHASIPALKK
jgi:hypothetical protein